MMADMSHHCWGGRKASVCIMFELIKPFGVIVRIEF